MTALEKATIFWMQCAHFILSRIKVLCSENKNNIILQEEHMMLSCNIKFVPVTFTSSDYGTVVYRS